MPLIDLLSKFRAARKPCWHDCVHPLWFTSWEPVRQGGCMACPVYGGPRLRPGGSPGVALGGGCPQVHPSASITVSRPSGGQELESDLAVTDPGVKGS